MEYLPVEIMLLKMKFVHLCSGTKTEFFLIHQKVPKPVQKYIALLKQREQNDLNVFIHLEHSLMYMPNIQWQIYPKYLYDFIP